MADGERTKEKSAKEQSADNIERLKKIKKQRQMGVPQKAMAAAVAAVAVVSVVAVTGGMIGNYRKAHSGDMKVETVAASLETTPAPETEVAVASAEETKSIVLETTLSAEEIASIEYAEKVDSVIDGYANLGIAGVSGYLNIRKTPESFGEIVGKLQSGGACEVVDTTTDGWYKIRSGGVTGYVKSDYIYTGEKAREEASKNVMERAVINTAKLNVRAEANSDSEIVGQVLEDERYPIKSHEGGWIQIDNGYISDEYVTVRYALNEARKQDMRTTVLSLYDNLGVSNVSNYLNVRDNPSEEKGKIIAKLPSNAGCDILDTTEDGWYKIRSGGITGYVKSEFILTGQAAQDKAMQVAQLMAFANTDGVNVRTEPNTQSSIWTQIVSNEKFIVASQTDDWVEIELDDTNAYISSDLVDVKYGLNEAIRYTPVVAAENKPQPTTKASSKSSGSKSSSSSSSGSKTTSSVNTGAAGSNAGSVSSRRAEIANYAVQFVGNPYVYGGTSLTNGADCSGFTMSVMAHFGVSLPHNSGAQSNCGKAITSSELRPGDLIFYSGSGGINHVALYIGNGQVCHASSRKTGIKISTWNYRTPAKIRNVLGD